MNNTITTELPYWTTFYGQRISLSELSHQHMSNISYYFELVLGMEAPVQIVAEIETRFGGKVLPYHPLVSFTSEINILRRKGYTTGELNASIHVNGKWIGKIKYS